MVISAGLCLGFSKNPALQYALQHNNYTAYSYKHGNNNYSSNNTKNVVYTFI